MSFQDFVSNTELKNKRDEKRKYLEAKLSKIQAELDKKQRKKYERIEKGEGMWMLPSLEEKLEKERELYKSSKKSKKGKKDKKERLPASHKKKNKKRPKTKVKSPSSSEDSEGSSNGEDWVESSVPIPVTKGRPCEQESDHEEREQEEEWTRETNMLDFITSSSTSRADERAKTKLEEHAKKKESCIDQMGQHDRELNPYWKNGGYGLPPMKENAQDTDNNVGKKIGDGGKSWIRKAYERAKQQALEEDRRLEDIVNERWGSMEKLEALLRAAEGTRQGQNSSGFYGQSPVRFEAATSSTGIYEKEKGSQGSAISVIRPSCTSGHSGQSRRLGWRKSEPRIDKKSHPRAAESVHHPRSSREEGVPKMSANEQLRTDQKANETEGKSSQDPMARSARLTPRVAVKTSSGGDSSEEGSSSDDSDDSDSEIIEMRVLSTQEMNKLGARIMKAEMMGDQDQALKLKKELEANQRILEKRKQQGEQPSSSRPAKPEEVVLMQADKLGNLYPADLKKEASISSTGRRKRQKRKKIVTHDEEGKRVRYFESEEKIDIKKMYRQERVGGYEAQFREMANLAAKFQRSNDESYTLDDFYEEGTAVTGSEKREEAYKRKQAIAGHGAREKAQQDCPLCITSKKIAKHLIVAMGMKTYLALPAHASLTDGHCKIIPMDHLMAATYADEDVASEIERFKVSLVTMFKTKEMDVIFLETFKHTGGRYHMTLECIPVPVEVGDTAPIYFKKAIMESESEWSQNRKVVAVKKHLGVRKAVPVGLPYFAVEFGLEGGYAHVIEEVESFPSYFGTEIIGGMLDIDHLLWKKPKLESFQQHKTKVLQFADWWKEHDWTRS